jgi:hypothetical protein
MQEENLFERYTWNGEHDTVEIAIMVKGNGKGRTLESFVERYLESMDFKLEGEASRQQRTKRNTLVNVYDGWVVNMSSKKFKRITTWEVNVMERNQDTHVPRAWPSQLTLYMQSHKGTLVGHRFGI